MIRTSVSLLTMNIDKGILVNIVLLIHMTLTGIMLFRLFKLKNTTGGQLILTFVALTIPILGPSALIVYYNNLTKKQLKTPNSKTNQSSNYGTKKGKKKR